MRIDLFRGMFLCVFAFLAQGAFAFLQRRSAQAAEFFNMPTRGVMVLATEIEL